MHESVDDPGNPRIEVGSETMNVVADEDDLDGRERLFARPSERYPQLHELARNTPVSS
jgi:hypothetical protein